MTNTISETGLVFRKCQDMTDKSAGNLLANLMLQIIAFTD
jgi:hypothetical protein